MKQKSVLRVAAALVVCSMFGASAYASWQYGNSVDSMTGKQSDFATVESSNSLSLDFPYKGKNYGHLIVRKHPRYGLSVVFAIDQGQTMCGTSSGCDLLVRFDDRPAVQYSGSASSDHDPKVVFLNNASRFIAEAAKAKKILVQVSLFHAGSPILEFYTPDTLQWGAKK